MEFAFHPGSGESGLVVGDLGLRVYAGAVPDPTTASEATLTAAATGVDYTIGGLPDGGASYTMTGEYPAGVWHAWRWGSPTTHPAQLILPIREAGHTLSSLAVKVFRDGVEYTAGVVLSAALDSPGDYSLSGWPVASAFGERWSVRWEYEGITFAETWVSDGYAAAATGYESEGDVIRARLLTWAETPISWDDATWNGPAVDPATSAAWIRPVIRNAGAEWAAIGGNATTKARAQGVLIVQIFAPRAEGDETIRQLADSMIAHFNRYSAAGVIFRWRGAARAVGLDGDQVQWNVEMPYYRDVQA